MSLLQTNLTPPPLPASAQPLLDQLFSGKFLGASRNTRQINDLFCAIADAWEGAAEELSKTLLATGEFLAATRGRNTPAIGNAIRLVLSGLDGMESSRVADIRDFIRARREEYNTRSLDNIARIAEYGANLLSGCETVLAYDYSSTMLAILERVADQGQRLRVIVPESRALDGGRPIVNEATARGHSVLFIVDMAFAHFLPESDAVLIGAETIFANGDCWNTIGSYPVALVAYHYHVPFYVATELLKIDPRSFVGLTKSVEPFDYAQILDRSSLRHPDLVSTVAPDLDNVPASLITAYVTPVGTLLPQHLRAEAERFLESIGVGVLPK